eukprot:gnl/TRDRNA2_/TRDRNA2_177892_c0_seq3.p1 gnl/TRDRNA2_/TRDRNA2_177892_c0~~gnl/TRDRNA2_/TRDRNA2_177892_c0_seq3.p1  ORF type:complete len:401 (-),score=-17.54 gnl/TRDRNA2_/TRDRNA2_177892_c0_seq3:87-1289(-)
MLGACNFSEFDSFHYLLQRILFFFLVESFVSSSRILHLLVILTQFKLGQKTSHLIIECSQIIFPLFVTRINISFMDVVHTRLKNKTLLYVSLMKILRRVIEEDYHLNQVNHKILFDGILEIIDMTLNSGMMESKSIDNENISTNILLLFKKSKKTDFVTLFLRFINWASTLNCEGNFFAFRIELLFCIVKKIAYNLQPVFLPYFFLFLNTCIFAQMHSLVTLDKISNDSTKTNLLKIKMIDNLTKIWIQVVRKIRFFSLNHGVNCFDLSMITTMLYQFFKIIKNIPDSDTYSDILGFEFSKTLIEIILRKKDFLINVFGNHEFENNNEASTKFKLLILRIMLLMLFKIDNNFPVNIDKLIQFIAVFLEDPELVIKNKTRTLVFKLEELTGESLESYLRCS